MTRFYCTYFDQNYLARALALHESLCAHGGDFQLDVLCLDEATANLLARLKLRSVRSFPLGELLAADSELAAARENRTWVEFIWTLTAPLVQHALRRNPQADMMTYLDADLYFYSSPEPIFEEMGGGSVTIIPHRFVSNVAAQVANSGIYNVGMMSFRRDVQAAAVLAWWREQCLAACHATAKDGKFGDQKYLDDWPERFAGVVVINHPGANLAPWNVAGHRIACGSVGPTADERPVIFYHFHRLDILGRSWYRCGIKGVSGQHVDVLYRPYIHALRRAYATLGALVPGFTGGMVALRLAQIWRWIRYRRLHFIYER